MVLMAIAVVACARQPKEDAPKPVPHWVTSTRINATASRPSFDQNVEVFVNIENLSSTALSLTGLDNEEIVLRTAAGESSTLHPLSVGVAKPIVLPPGQTTRTSLLFKPLREAPTGLKVYGRESKVTPLPIR